MKLTTIQAIAVAVIKDQGGEIFPDVGGWWKDKDGKRVALGVNVERPQSWLSCGIVFSLWNKGYLEEVESPDPKYNAYKLTEKANETTEETATE